MQRVSFDRVDFFLGATTPAGFKGYFEPLRREPGMQMVLIKSGPGCGKSTIGRALAKTLGQVWQAHPAQGLYAITADAEFEQHFGKKAARRRKIYNGMIPCQLYMYFEQPKRERK